MTIATVKGYLSAVRTALKRARIEIGDDAGLTADLLGSQLSKRRRLGTEVKKWKLPIMPRFIMQIEARLVDPSGRSSLLAANSSLVYAYVIFYLSYFFGWRTRTASSVSAADFVFVVDEGVTTAIV